MDTPIDNSRLATRRGFLTTAAFASASAFSLKASGATRVEMTWTMARRIVEDGAIGEVRYISAMVPLANVMDAHLGSLSVFAPARAVKTEHSRHSMTGALSMRCEVEGGAQIVVAGISDQSPSRITIEGSGGRVHIVDSVVSVQSRGEWREFVV